MKGELVCDGVPFGEGPVWCDDGSLVITHVAPGALRRIDPGSGRSEVFAETAGGANAAQLAADGGFVVTQNGGMDFTPFAGHLHIPKDEVPAYRPVTPGLQRVSPTGEVSYLADQGFQAPNDLIVAADGTVFFTDPPHITGMPDRSDPKGRLWAYSTSGEVALLAEGFFYDNGIALSPEGRILIVESNGLLWIDRDGSREWFVEELPGGTAGDGFAFDREGRVYVCCPGEGRLRVLDRDGKPLEVFELGEGSSPTNCAFGGADGRTLFTTELFPGRVLAFEGLPSPGLPLHRWPSP